MYDVVIVGAGPAGSLAAKKCAEFGLKTLLVEKKPLPRDKVCTGMVMGRIAQEIVEKEFGTIPDSVLTRPGYLSGYMLHVPGVEPQPIEHRMPFAWRRDLDFWMTRKAKDAGVEIRDRVNITSVVQTGEKCIISLDDEKVETKFIIGADGAKSTIRGIMYPNLKFVYRTVYRECYKGELNLDPNYFHLFFPSSQPRPRFNVNHKGNSYLIEGNLKELKTEITGCLTPYGFQEDYKPLWKDGCLDAPCLEQGTPVRSFIPVVGNILVVGDAAMLQMPVTGEGIGMALKSGLFAAQSIADSINHRSTLEKTYLPGYESLLNIIKELDFYDSKVEHESKKGPDALLNAFSEGFRATAKVI